MASSRSHPDDIRPKGWFAVLKRTMAEVSNDHISLIAAGCAFYGLLAIFPGIVAGMAVAGLFFDSSSVVSQAGNLAAFMPEQAATIVLDQAKAVAGSDSGGLGLAAILGVATAFYSATAGLNSLMEGLNVAFDIQDERGFVKRTLVKFALTLGMIAGFMLIIGILLLLPVVLGFLPWDNTTETIIVVIRWPLVLAVVVGGLAILYQYGPDRADRQWRWITPGAALSCTLWLLGSVAFAYYVRNFGSYNETFGTLGGVIVLLMWLWLSSFIVLLGAEFDSEMEEQGKDHAPAPAPTAAPSAPREGAFDSAHTS